MHEFGGASTHLVQWPADGDVLDTGQSEHGQRADESEQRRRKHGGDEHYKHSTQGGATAQHVGEIPLEQEERVVAQPRQDARDDVDRREVDEERVVYGVSTARGVSDGKQGGGVGDGTDDGEGALHTEASRREIRIEEHRPVRPRPRRGMSTRR